MITDKQFEDSFTAVGGWFFLINFETMYNWRGTKNELIDKLFAEGFDANRSGTTTRVSSSLRIIENNRGEEALVKIRNSARINQQHPDAKRMADFLLKQYYNLK